MFAGLAHGQSGLAQDFFSRGTQAYESGEYERAAADFRQAAAAAPSPGVLQNLGNAEWKCGRAGPAVLAWERSQWLDPFSPNARANLRFARKASLLDAPELAWYEICSAWLPAGAWAWLASLSFWFTAAMALLPWALRWRKAGWHQALAAAGLAVFLLTIPAMAGVESRAKIGVVLAKDTPLRLTPTADGQAMAKLAAGETVRFERARGAWLFIRSSAGSGWIDRQEFGLVSAKPAPPATVNGSVAMLRSSVSRQ